MMPRWSPFEPYFWSLVKKTDGCWIWTGGLDGHGYGRVWREGRRQGSHRVSFQLTNGRIPDGMYVCHHCDNPICVNPGHLFLGTHSDNMRDCTNKGRNKLIESPELWKRGNNHWTRKKTKKSKMELQKISDKRKQEWNSGRRVAIRDSKGRIMGTRMISP